MKDWYYSVQRKETYSLTALELLQGNIGKNRIQREFVELQLSPIWEQLKLPAEDNKLRQTDCVNTKNQSP